MKKRKKITWTLFSLSKLKKLLTSRASRIFFLPWKVYNLFAHFLRYKYFKKQLRFISNSETVGTAAVFTDVYDDLAQRVAGIKPKGLYQVQHFKYAICVQLDFYKLLQSSSTSDLMSKL